MPAKSDKTIIKVGIVDDKQLIIEAISLVLTSLKGLRLVLKASSGAELLQLLKESQNQPDILLMDKDMRGVRGVEATRQVTALYPHIQVIAFTSHDNSLQLMEMINAGASAYLIKHADTAEVEKAIRSVYETGRYYADSADPTANGFPQSKEEMEELTKEDIRFLKLHFKCLVIQDLAKRMNLTPPMVDEYKSSVFEKLGRTNIMDAVLEALDRGIIDREEMNNLNVEDI